MRIKPNCITTWPSLGRTRRGSIEYRPVKFATRFKYRSSPNDTRESGPQPDFRGYILKHCKQWFSTRIDARESFHIPPSTKEISQQSEKRRITLDIHGRVYTVDSLKLRDACTCKLCVDASTTQKLFSTTDIPGQIRAGLGQVYPDGSFSVSWSSDVPGIEGHSSRYPPGFLATRMGCGSIENRARREIPRIPWGRRGLKESQITFHYDSYLNDPLTCRAVTESLMRYGMAYIAFVPPDPGSVGHIASRIGSIMRTIYGETWDVRSVESPKNVADRDSDINFHMDLLYYVEPPRLQLLHCLKQSQHGGDSLFTDGFRAVSNLALNGMQRLGQEESNGWKRIMMALTKNLIPYHYKNNGQWLEHPHPTIMLSNSDGSGKWADTMQHLHHPTRLSDAFKAVRWSPPFQAPLPLETTNLPDIGWWLAGAKMLKHEFEHEEAVLRTKLSEGTCVIFDNWRVLHARKGFSGGERWLRGAYVGETEFQQCMLGLASESFR